VSQEWYYSVDGDRQGPIGGAELKKLAEAGTLKPNDLVWRDGMADWVQAKSIKGLFGAAAASGSKSGEQAAARAKPGTDEADARPARARRRDEDDEEDDRPRRRRDEDEEEEDRPVRSRRRDEEDEEDDRAVRRRDEDEDEDEEDDDRPRRRGKRRIPEDVASKKMTAAIIGIVGGVLGLGWIGIHKFMLGKTKAGLIMLLGSVLTCFIGAIVFNIFALIEGIIYITKSDEEFYETYIIGDKEWF